MNTEDENIKFLCFHTIMHNKRSIPILKIHIEKQQEKILKIKKRIEIFGTKKKRRPLINSLDKAATLWAEKIQKEQSIQNAETILKAIYEEEKTHENIVKNCIYYLN